uniref:AlNc14C25G2517 protein n=1 Tax=Albugo laibachii Nc14 TaxID=890382 RepID=F0W6M9_9STRA|nr:AlNc14C25G2517 [Albugo laibachii Nc14]|eukprot:CCA16774.1 AlNc14C25G2517 [Albugo laibachii Nc14]
MDQSTSSCNSVIGGFTSNFVATPLHGHLAAMKLASQSSHGSQNTTYRTDTRIRISSDQVIHIQTGKDYSLLIVITTSNSESLLKI